MRVPFLGMGSLLIIAGAIVLLGQTGAIDASEIIGDWWPLAIVWIAVMQWLGHPRTVIGPLLLALVGVAILGATSDVIDASPAATIIALGLIVVGGVILRAAFLDGRRVVHRPDEMDSLVVFGGRDLVSRADPFESGSLITLFGGTEVDLSAARLSERGASIGTVTIFGGTEITVPDDWRVEVRVTPILGGVSDETVVDAPPGQGEHTLVIDGVAIFGALEVRNPDVGDGDEAGLAAAAGGAAS